MNSLIWYLLRTSGRVKVCTSKVLRPPSWLGEPLTNHWWYVPLMEQEELLTLPEQLSSPLFLVVFVLLNLWVSVKCCVYRCLCLCPFSFGYCNVCRISPLWKGRPPLSYDERIEHQTTWRGKRPIVSLPHGGTIPPKGTSVGCVGHNWP